MAFGDHKDDGQLREGWRKFCQRLMDAGDLVFKDYNPATALNRADGFRYLMQNLSQTYDLAYETKDPRYPFIHAFSSIFCHFGGDSAEFTYQQAWIEGT